ncbi:apoptosis-associated speck-like protein containing a CARD [Sinocyclocheilus rhinocerous]|uniref:apoptosis-associated speck-like protein containing a CARD n=1 Tax=Sinocyclocheilus rhinocerous TaxID=307959 RepID=UPI0007B99418|nr:PREDICTED: apoptosis-associated speck-like protein containing a CARD [Sinocyclocheilus rhinocerous]
MAKTIKDHLQDTFDDLGEENQKRFKSKLCDRKTEPRVRRAAIEKAKDSIDLADLMVNTFTSTGAVPVTIEILQAICCNQQATEFKENTGQYTSELAVVFINNLIHIYIVSVHVYECATWRFTVRVSLTLTCFSAAPLVPLPGPGAPSIEHFIDRNRTKLRRRVYNVDAILDELLDKKVITEEVYSNIRAEKTPQIKMRELLMGPIKSAGTKGKDALYKALKDTDVCLIEDLEHQ